jgi:pyrroloquinoline quinone (PQQ) biosynthesis protein C
MSKIRCSDQIDLALRRYRDEYNVIVNAWLCDEGTFGVTYPAFLTETYHYVRSSCGLMDLAKQGTASDRVALRNFWDKHIREELGHEEWALNDLEVLGYNRMDAVRSDPLAETVALIGSQLYLIEFVSPVALLGYAYMMESKPPNQQFLEAMQDTFAIPAAAMSFLIGHGDADIAHREELREIVDTLVEGESEERALVSSAVFGLSHINRMLQRIRSGHYTSIRPLPVLPVRDGRFVDGWLDGFEQRASHSSALS